MRSSLNQGAQGSNSRMKDSFTAPAATNSAGGILRLFLGADQQRCLERYLLASSLRTWRFATECEVSWLQNEQHRHGSDMANLGKPMS